ncbi:DNA topoisomerase IV [Flavobacterium suzhouense]|uniref:DNA topoisomerase IV n=1 Tax=Flavobacterium suzhouense TaxID=1529638 RepID=A0ABW5NV91_9FLAO
MKNFIFAIVITALFSSCYQQERNCKDFKTGKFKFEHEINGKKEVTYFERTENLQIETFNGKTDTASVRWVNDCEYILQKTHPKNMLEQKAIHMKILTTSQDSYTFEFSIVGDTNKQKGTVTKLK